MKSKCGVIGQWLLFCLMVFGLEVPVSAQARHEYAVWTPVPRDNAPIPHYRATVIMDTAACRAVPELDITVGQAKLSLHLKPQSCQDDSCRIQPLADGVRFDYDGSGDAGQVYRLGNGDLEWEFILADRPADSIFRFTYESSGLSFHRQDTTLFETGSIYTPEIINSYAVYMTGDRSGSSGKICHIFRPLAFDALSKDGIDSTWCDLTIDTLAGEFRISIPSSFLNHADYPVTIDPTFGFMTIGAVAITRPTAVACLFNTHSAGPSEAVIRYHVYGRAVDTASQVMMAAYTIDGGLPDARLATPANFIVDTVTGWYQTDAVLHPMSTGAEYCVAVGYPSPGVMQLYYDVRQQVGRSYHDSHELDAFWSSTGTSNATYSMYATYEVQSAVEAVALRRRAATTLISK